jgi:nucleotide-binding universal stress UspA family protein
MKNMTPPQHILVATDFSEAADCALSYARAMAHPLDAKLHLLYVIPDPYSLPWLLHTSGVDVRHVIDTWKAQAQQRLEALRPDETTAVVTTVGRPFLEIVRYAKTHDIDLIVMGLHGQGTVSQVLIGSVAEKVVRSAPCPVLTVRAPR